MTVSAAVKGSDEHAERFARIFPYIARKNTD